MNPLRGEVLRAVLISDLHGNWQALEAILKCLQSWGIEFSKSRSSEDGPELIFLGDQVDPLPNSVRVVDWIADNGFRAIRGNHEDYILAASGGNAPHDLKEKIYSGWRFSPVQKCARTFNEKQLSIMESWSEQICIKDTRLIHAGLQSNRKGDFRGLNKIKETLIVGGHFHDPMKIRWGTKTLQFIGAAGIPLRRTPWEIKTEFALLWLNPNGECRIENCQTDFDHAGVLKDYLQFFGAEDLGPVEQLIAYELESGLRTLGSYFRWIRRKFGIRDIEDRSRDWALDRVAEFLKLPLIERQKYM